MEREYEELRAAIVSGLRKDYLETGLALAEVRDRELYRESGFDSFSAWIEAEIGCHRSTCHRNIQAAEVAQDLEANGSVWLPLSHAILLHPLDTPDRVRLAKLIRAKTFRKAFQIVALEIDEPNRRRTQPWRKKPPTIHELSIIQQAFAMINAQKTSTILHELEEFGARRGFIAKMRKVFELLKEEA